MVTCGRASGRGQGNTKVEPTLPDYAIALVFQRFDVSSIDPRQTYPWTVSKSVLAAVRPVLKELLIRRHHSTEDAVYHLTSNGCVMLLQMLVGASGNVDVNLRETILSVTGRGIVAAPRGWAIVALHDELVTAFMGVRSNAGVDNRQAVRAGIVAGVLGPVLSVVVPANYNRSQPLMYAVKNDDVDAVESMLSARHNAAIASIQAFLKACERGNVEIVRTLACALYTRDNVIKSEGLIVASRYGHLEVVRFLLELAQHPAAADFRQSQALVEASGRGYVGIVRCLVEAGTNPADPNTQRNEALIRASRSGFAETVRVLLTTENAGTNTPVCQDGASLILACANGHVETVRLLLEPTQYRAGVYGQVISAASSNGHTEVVRVLLDHSNIWTAGHTNALSLAGMAGHDRIVRLLVVAQGHFRG